MQMVQLLCVPAYLPTRTSIRQSKRGLLGCLCRKVVRSGQPLLTAPALFSISLFHVSLVSSLDYPRELGKRSLFFHSVSGFGYGYFCFFTLCLTVSQDGEHE